MCQFIFAVLPREVHFTSAAEVFRRHGLGFRRVDNSHVAAQLAPGDVCVQTTHHICDCGTPLGSLARIANGVDAAAFEAKLTRLRRHHWSEAKIARWQAERTVIAGRDERRRAGLHAQNVVFAADWERFVRDILKSRVTTRIGLLLRWGHDFETDRPTLGAPQRVSVAELSADQLLYMSEDTVYHFHDA